MCGQRGLINVSDRVRARFRTLLVAGIVAFGVPWTALASDLGVSSLDPHLSSQAAADAATFERPAAQEVAQATAGREVAQATGGTKSEGEEDFNDPLEDLNRFFFTFNEDIAYGLLLRPLANLYNRLPVQLRRGLGNAIDNLNSPIILANDLLQGEWKRAWQTTERAVINSTVGVGGLFDVADMLEIPKHDEDFGQTLAVWGVGEGFYLVLPVLGPSNPRDAIGKFGADPFLDPLNLYLSNIDEDEFIYLRQGVTAVDKFSRVVDELDEVKKTSIDYYAAIRSLYRQKRKSEIANGRELELPPIPDLTSTIEEELSSQPGSSASLVDQQD